MHTMQRNGQDQKKILRTAKNRMQNLRSIRTRPGLCHYPLVHFGFTPMIVKARFRADMSIGCFCGSVPSVGLCLAFAWLLDLGRREQAFLSTRGRHWGVVSGFPLR